MDSTLIVALRNGDWRVRADAARKLGRTASPHAVAVPQAAFADPYWQVRAEAAAALGQLPAPGAIPTLVDWLEDENANVRQAAARDRRARGAGRALITQPDMAIGSCAVRGSLDLFALAPR